MAAYASANPKPSNLQYAPGLNKNNIERMYCFHQAMKKHAYYYKRNQSYINTRKAFFILLFI